jgi:hypothetical protein
MALLLAGEAPPIPLGLGFGEWSDELAGGWYEDFVSPGVRPSPCFTHINALFL